MMADTKLTTTQYSEDDKRAIELVKLKKSNGYRLDMGIHYHRQTFLGCTKRKENPPKMWMHTHP